MRTDEGLDESVTKTDAWGESDQFDGSQMAQVVRTPEGREIRRANSFSGHERNRLFLSSNGASFEDVSPLSGADSAADSRAFVLWDYDRDGWQDIAVVNANRPLVQLYRNEMGQLQGASKSGHTIAIRFVGANRSAGPLAGKSCRDGYGALVTVTAGGKTIVREHRCGEGFAAQNSSTMLIGIGAADVASKVVVRWPGGDEQSIDAVAAGSLLTADEEGGRFSSAPYARSVQPARTVARSLGSLDLGPSSGRPRLRVYTSMATWCAACRAHLPKIARLRKIVGSSVSLIGLPTDANDTQEKLREYLAAFRPGYDLYMDMTSAERDEVRALYLKHLGREVLPSSIVTNCDGKVLAVLEGLPTLSDLGRLMDVQAGAIR